MVEDRAGIVRLLDVARNVNGAVSAEPYIRQNITLPGSNAQSACRL
jgi:hypothetical protein